ncbi:MAG: hypothetical protein WBB19_02275 [Desulforhopalus sp.]
MKNYLWTTLALLFLTMFAASSLHAGYKRDPWGSKTWTGPGRPPHWSPEPPPHQTEPKNHVDSIDSRESNYRDREPHRYGDKGFFRKDNLNRWYNYNSSRHGTIYIREPEVEQVIIEREKRVPVYVPVKRQPSKLQCGGSTITSSDPETGEMVIEYVTGARDC